MGRVLALNMQEAQSSVLKYNINQEVETGGSEVKCYFQQVKDE